MVRFMVLLFLVKAADGDHKFESIPLSDHSE